MSELTLPDLLAEYANSQAYSLSLINDLTPDQVHWRPDEHGSSMAWHLGHQGAVNHYLVRNLTSAEVTFNAGFDKVFDSATPEPERCELPTVEAIIDYREAIAESTLRTISRIDSGDVGAPEQLKLIAHGLIRAVINHEYQHAKWIEEVCTTMTGASTAPPTSDRIEQVEGYWMLIAD